MCECMTCEKNSTGAFLQDNGVESKFFTVS